eukprot:70555_1
MTREIITINAGQAGIQLGSQIWEQYNAEHNINLQGNRYQNDDQDTSFLNFYEHDDSDIFKARTLMIDSEPNIIENVKTSRFSNIYHTDCLLSHNDGSGGCFTRGRYFIGDQMMDTINERLRKMVENCDHIQGFIMNHSVAGGTGSGLGTLILEQINIEYDKKNTIGYHIFPFNNNYSNNYLEPYNSVLTTSHLCENINISLLFDNRQIFNICRNKLHIQQPTYSQINGYISKLISSITYGLRFQQDIDYNLQEMMLSTVPFDRLQFLISSLSPLIPCDENNPMIIKGKKLINGYVRENSMIDAMYKDIMDMIYSIYGIYKYEQPSLRKVSMDSVTKEYFSVEVPNNYSQYARDDGGVCSYISASSMDNFLSCYINFGGDIQSKQADEMMKDLRYEIQWASLSLDRTSGYKYGWNKRVCSVLPNDCMKMGEKQISMIGSNAYVGRFFNERIGKVCNKMYSQRAFVHWFVGKEMEEDLSDAITNVRYLTNDYLDSISEQYS